MPPCPTHAGLTPECSLCREPWRGRGGLLRWGFCPHCVKVGLVSRIERERQAREVPGKSVLCSLFCVTCLVIGTGAGGFQCPWGRGVTPAAVLLPVHCQLLVDTCAHQVPARLWWGLG